MAARTRADASWTAARIGGAAQLRGRLERLEELRRLRQGLQHSRTRSRSACRLSARSLRAPRASSIATAIPANGCECPADSCLTAQQALRRSASSSTSTTYPTATSAASPARMRSVRHGPSRQACPARTRRGSAMRPAHRRRASPRRRSRIASSTARSSRTTTPTSTDGSQVRRQSIKTETGGARAEDQASADRK